MCSVLPKPAAHFHMGSGALFLRTQLFSNTALIFLRVVFLEYELIPLTVNFFNYPSEKQTEAGRNERYRDHSVNDTRYFFLCI